MNDSLGTYKNKLIHRWGMVLTLCQCGKLFLGWVQMWITFFGFVILSGERYGGDNPSGHFYPTFSHICFPLFTTEIVPTYVKRPLFPL
jgi:hypothetical protein